MSTPILLLTFPFLLTGAVTTRNITRGTGNIYLDYVRCNGTETSLVSCPANRNTYCDHYQDAGVICMPNG